VGISLLNFYEYALPQYNTNEIPTSLAHLHISHGPLGLPVYYGCCVVWIHQDPTTDHHEEHKQINSTRKIIHTTLIFK